jgi:uncharacterized membrane protein YbhN (UPF0104 family)
MTRRSWLSLCASVALAAILLALLIAASHIDWSTIVRQLTGMNLPIVLVLTAIFGLNVVLGGEKWRLVDRRVRGVEAALPRSLYAGLSAVGALIGLIVPMQFGAAVTRTLGLHFFGGRAIVRGTAATFYEQFYDVLVAGFLAPASVVLIIAGGSAIEWLLCASAASVLGLIATAAASAYMTRHLGRAAALRASQPAGRLSRVVSGIAGSGLLGPKLACQLFALSLLRFVGLTAMAAATTNATGLAVPLWQLSAALPLVILATAVPVTPGGLGVNEWAFTSVLVGFGTSFGAAAQWVVLNRLIVTIACVVVGLAGALVVGAVRLSRTISPSGMKKQCP